MPVAIARHEGCREAVATVEAWHRRFEDDAGAVGIRAGLALRVMRLGHTNVAPRDRRHRGR